MSDESRAKIRDAALRRSPACQPGGRTRQEALASGHNKYTSSTPCPRGHQGERYTRSSSCVECHLTHFVAVHRVTRGISNAAYHARRLSEDPWALAHQSAKRRAKQIGVAFDITVEDVRAVWPPDGICPALGIRLAHGARTMLPSSPSLDRLRPELGYVRGNIAIISMRANRIKSNEVDPWALRKIADWLETTLNDDPCVNG